MTKHRPKLANQDQPFIILLKEMLADPELRKTWNAVADERKKLQLNRRMRTLNDKTRSFVRIAREDLAPFVQDSDHEVTMVRAEDIVKGTFPPAEGHIVRLTQNFAMYPEDEKTKEFVQLGNQYVQWYTEKTQAAQQPQTAVAQAKGNSSDFKDELYKLFASRKLLGNKIFRSDSKELKNTWRKATDLSLLKVAGAIGISQHQANNCVNGVTKNVEGQLENTVLPILDYLNADDEERRTIIDALKARSNAAAAPTQAEKITQGRQSSTIARQ